MRGRGAVAVVLGASWRDLDVVERVGARYAKSIVIDRDPHPVIDSCADSVFRIDLCDVAEIVRAVESLDARGGIECVITRELGLHAGAALADRFALKYPRVAQLVGCFDKSTAKAVWRANGVPTPPSYTLQPGQAIDVADILTRLGDGLVVKPSAGSGGRGVRSVDGALELRRCIGDLRDEPILVERRIAGPTGLVVGDFKRGRYRPVGFLRKVSDRFGNTTGVTVDPADGQGGADVHRLVARAASLIGATDGPVCADLVIDTSGPMMLEVTPMLPGRTARTALSLSRGRLGARSGGCVAVLPLRADPTRLPRDAWVRLEDLGPHHHEARLILAPVPRAVPGTPVGGLTDVGYLAVRGASVEGCLERMAELARGLELRGVEGERIPVELPLYR